MSAVFVINPGGASKKYALYVSGRRALEAIFECGSETYQVTTRDANQKETLRSITKPEYEDSLVSFAAEVVQHLKEQKLQLTAIGVRVLASGSTFQQHQLIDDVFISLLREKEPTAPLHIPITLYEIQQCKIVLPGIPMVAVSDTEFFRTLPAIAREYSLPREDVKNYDLHRFGYHGLSVSSVIERVHAVIGRDPERIVVCHLGSGMSVTGVRSLNPVYSSAGFSSCSSLPMTTRGGDADAGVTLELLRLQQSKCYEVSNYLHKKSGLLALSGTDDVRTILNKRSQGDPNATFALDLLAFEIQKAIASASVATGGIDALVFTGTIGFRSPELRRLVISGLTHFGIALDDDKNNLFLGREGVISPTKSLSKVAVMRTDEMSEIAQHATRLAEHKKSA